MALRRTFWITLALSVSLIISLGLNAFIYYTFKDWVISSNVNQVIAIQYRAFRYKEIRSILENGDIEAVKGLLGRRIEGERQVLEHWKNREDSPDETRRAAELALKRIKANQEYGVIKDG